MLILPDLLLPLQDEFSRTIVAQGAGIHGNGIADGIKGKSSYKATGYLFKPVGSGGVGVAFTAWGKGSFQPVGIVVIAVGYKDVTASCKIQSVVLIRDEAFTLASGNVVSDVLYTAVEVPGTSCLLFLTP
ncbi:MAG: hypothetical protein CSA20_01015 [Deltaproteobacteria bacterium]|nr:MAG: hypothetical protein CSA20_01015 [Deltaproteobacteria bacterium]